jgi:CO/xanthine dehydrogenase FAD-binding subunit
MRNLREYHRPETMEQALKLLSREDLDTALLGGGTYLAAQPCAGPEAVVDLSALPLAYIARPDAALRIGGLTRLEEISNDPTLRGFAGGLVSQAARLSCSSLLRNQGTLAGTILSPSGGELVSVLLALDALVLLQTLEGPVTRHISQLEGPESCRRAILIEVLCPEPPPGSRIRRERIARTPADRAILSVTAIAQVIDGSIAGCRVSVAGAGLRPMRLRNLETALAGAPARAEIIDSVSRKEAALIEMHDSTLAGTEYRRAMIPVLISRAVLGSGC